MFVLRVRELVSLVVRPLAFLLDELPESDIADYVLSMQRLREIPARIVHGGHDDSFGRERLLELIDGYVRTRT